LRNACPVRVWQVNVVEALLDIYPNATLHQDVDGCVPLHEVAASSGSEDVLRAILDTSPEAAAIVDTKYSELPLHCACRAADNGQPKLDAVLLLLEDYPEGALVADADGRLPMHWAAEGSPDATGRMIKADEEVGRPTRP
jgi:ankyrin repeat protein